MNQVLLNARLSISRELKKRPPMFDLAKRVLRAASKSDAIYTALERFHGKPVIFAQIGANDGMSVDPLREFVVANPKWRGLLVEPVPWIFETLQKNYAYVNKSRRLRFVNAAIGSETGMRPFWKIRDDLLHEFPPFAYQVGSFSRAHVLKHFHDHPGIDKKVESISVRCETFASLCASYEIEKLDILHMDVEGHEPEILRSIDYAAVAPKLILFEIDHMDNETKEQIFAMLSSHGYGLKLTRADCIAARDQN